MPQGTKLAPLLYILYANDIAKIFKFAKVKMYLDDLSIYAAVNNNEGKNKFQNMLNKLVNRATKWQLKINFDKCHVIYFGNNLYFDYNLDVHNIIVSKCEKVLGIYIDEELSFKEHVYEC